MTSLRRCSSGIRWMACASVAVALVAGCDKPHMSMDDMKPPARPMELDKLNMMAGHWTDSYEMTIGNQPPIKTTGMATREWCCNNRFLSERYEGKMPDGTMMTGMGMWTWDAEDKVYRSWWFDSWGSMAEGTATWDESKRTWTMRGKSENPTTGEESSGKGMMRVVDDQTMEWQWTECDGWGKPTMSMKGTSRKASMNR